MHGYLAYIPVALGAFALTGLVVFAVVYNAPWRNQAIATEDKRLLRQWPVQRTTGLLSTDPPIALGTTVTGTGNPLDYYTFTATPGLRLVLQLGGATAVIAGVWTGTSTSSPTGFLRVCGLNAWGVREVPTAGPCVIQVQNETGGAYTLMVRKYLFLYDDVQSWFHKSSC